MPIASATTGLVSIRDAAASWKVTPRWVRYMVKEAKVRPKARVMRADFYDPDELQAVRNAVKVKPKP